MLLVGRALKSRVVCRRWMGMLLGARAGKSKGPRSHKATKSSIPMETTDDDDGIPPVKGSLGQETTSRSRDPMSKLTTTVATSLFLQPSMLREASRLAGGLMSAQGAMTQLSIPSSAPSWVSQAFLGLPSWSSIIPSPLGLSLARGFGPGA